MKRKIYVETSVINYLTARPSKTIIGAAHQQITLAWWELRSDYELLVSQSVWQECGAGDPVAAQKRLAALEEGQRCQAQLKPNESFIPDWRDKAAPAG